MGRKIAIYGTYFTDFYLKQTDKVKDKIDYVLELIKHEERVPKKFLKHLAGTDGLYEIRIISTFSNIRIFCFFDDGMMIILTNCFMKKSQKTPKKHLNLAIKLRKEYFNKKSDVNE